jgi:hypothetical protein
MMWSHDCASLLGWHSTFRRSFLNGATVAAVCTSRSIVSCECYDPLCLVLAPVPTSRNEHQSANHGKVPRSQAKIASIAVRTDAWTGPRSCYARRHARRLVSLRSTGGSARDGAGSCIEIDVMLLASASCQGLTAADGADGQRSAWSKFQARCMAAVWARTVRMGGRREGGLPACLGNMIPEALVVRAWILEPEKRCSCRLADKGTLARGFLLLVYEYKYAALPCGPRIGKTNRRFQSRPEGA